MIIVPRHSVGPVATSGTSAHALRRGMNIRHWLAIVAFLVVIPVPTVTAQSTTASLWALNRCGAGDTVQYTLLAAGAIDPAALSPGGVEIPSYTEAFRPLQPFLAAADLGMAILAGPLAGGTAPVFATALAEHKLLLLGAAHPRLLDLGPSGVTATLQTLSRHGIYQHGAADNRDAPPFLKVTVPHPNAPLTIGFLSATWGLDGNADPRGQLNILADVAGVLPSITTAIEQARRQTELVVVMTAWGQPSDPDPNQARFNAARNLIAAGADVVIGSIPGTTATVNWVQAGEREGLLIVSPGDLISNATTPAFLAYIGVARDTDGAVRVTGFRYLPINPGNGNRGPTPLPDVPNELATLLGDPGRLHAVPSTPPPTKVEVCPAIVLPEAPNIPIPGDFARFYQTFGSDRAQDLINAIALLGLPLESPRRELTGDCRQEVAVLYTERQRLELHPENDWPYRVLGSHLGTVAFRYSYPSEAVRPRTNLDDPATFAHPHFRAFYERYGGLSMFGYPISGALTERDPTTGRDLVVQYFERARFELDPVALAPENPLWQVRLGLLGREVGSLAMNILCPTSIAPAASSSLPATIPALTPTIADIAQRDGGETLAIIFLIVLALAFVITLMAAMYDLYRYAERKAIPGLSRRRNYQAAINDTPSTRTETWQEQLKRITAWRRPASSSESESREDTDLLTTLKSFLFKRHIGKRDSDSATRNRSAWRQPSRSRTHQTQPTELLSAHTTNQRPTNPRTIDQATLRQRTAESRSPDSSNNRAEQEWLDETTSNLFPNRTDHPVDWSDLPPAERERWMQELEPLTETTDTDVPPAERARWQAEIETPAPMVEPDWDRTEPPVSLPANSRATRRLDDTIAEPPQQSSGDDDELLQKLLGIY
ncbi:MAG: CapA family protein [Chloroflexus sp.]|uniref:CapA family protein n=1 Tax=Chloroflexus sp. TaxID=1904827 RepID=UPI003D14746F